MFLESGNCKATPQNVLLQSTVLTSASWDHLSELEFPNFFSLRCCEAWFVSQNSAKKHLAAGDTLEPRNFVDEREEANRKIL